MNENKKPVIRFSGFTDAWEQRKLGELSDSFEYGLNAAATEYDGENKYIRITDIDDVSRRFVETDLTSPQIDLSNAGNYKLKIGDILFARTGASVGKSYIYNESDGLVYYAGFLIRTRIKPEYDAEFVFQSTLTSKYNDYIRINSQRSGQPGVNAQEYAEFSLLIPEPDEQFKIGTFFRNLDTLITLHQRKYDKLQNVKKSMLEKMFPKNGTNTPEIRFKGFNDAWEQRKLGEIADIVRGASPRPIKDPIWFNDESVIGWLRISDVTEQDGRIHFLEQRLSEAGQEKTRVLNEPHLLLSIAATVGKPVINYVQTGVHDGFLIFLNPKFDQEFMFQWLEMFRPQWQKFGQPGSQVNLNSDLVKNKDIMLPSDAEQIKIGNFFKNLDNLITLHQRELEKLQNIKKSCLERMFV